MVKLFSISAILMCFALPFLTEGSVEGVNGVTLHFFWTSGCPYCEQQRIFLEELGRKYPDLKIYQYDLHQAASVDILEKLIEKHPGSEKSFGAAPLTFIGDDFFVGFSQKIGDRIENSIKKYYKKTEEEIEDIEEEKEVFYLPVLGEIDPQKWSLGVLATVIGTIDGFNVCSLGALIIILILVFALHSRKLTFIFGGLFILAVVLVYGLLVFLWHQLFSVFLPYMSLMKIIIGLAAFFGAIYFLKQFFKFRKQGPVCKIGESKIITAASQKLESFFKEKKSLWILLAGVILFATLVTIIEFPCSAVFPVVFTGILAQAKLPVFTFLFYIFIYLFFYMLDEVVVFLVAAFTRKIWITSWHFMIWMSLVGSLVLFFLAYYYLFVL